MRKVELLSPAGGYETMVGAFNAGADAVYLGGSKFGARAYADNFDKDQVLDAVSYAHLHGKKIYMTVNTLVKEREFDQLYDFMLPFAEKKLDGVIVQDYGVMRFIRDEFPEIELHASTQQTVTGIYGAKLLKDLGCCRVVPARELSLFEMKNIREQADIEVEAFIHGAMCYCYSGACLFSSMVGGRSGNRGRCAQPCRLPYSLKGKGERESYPLSLKDMSTIGIIPELIEAGIDSFKIEGRMKKPEYSAGVTALYRKYIDMYYQNPQGDYRVSEEDMKMLANLYQRTGISEGYYHKHNGKDMVTISSPAYNATSDDILSKVREKYLSGTLKINCAIDCTFEVGKEASVSMKVFDGAKEHEVFVCGNEVQPASKRPMAEGDIRKQMQKLGNTSFVAEKININIDDRGAGTGIFMAVSELNDLRRRLCDLMEKELLMQSESKESMSVKRAEEVSSLSDFKKNDPVGDIHVLVSTKEQFLAILDEGLKEGYPGRIYIDSAVLLTMKDSEFSDVLKLSYNGCEVMASLPFVTREEEFDATKDIEKIIDICNKKIAAGILVRNIEQLGFLKSRDFSGRIILDYSVYNWNREATLCLLETNVKDGFSVSEVSSPLELTLHEACDFVLSLRQKADVPVSYNIYGHAPMMISAGCVKKTMDKCSGKLHEFNSEKSAIVDRMGNELTVTTDCRNCLNVIWNAYPTVLFKKTEEIRKKNLFDHLRVDFTTESGKRAGQIYRFVMNPDMNGDLRSIFGEGEYTTGHYKRGVE